MTKLLRVLYEDAVVGRLAINDQRQLAFEYSAEWIESGFDLAPKSLPFINAAKPSLRPAEFDGLPGVFNDSLPDGWGLLLMDRALKAHRNLDPAQITPLDRLAYMGHRCMGALSYAPELLPEKDNGLIDLADIAEQSDKVLNGDSAEVLDALRIYGGSPGGARPKVTVAFSADMSVCQSGFKSIPDGFSHWIVKFRNNSRHGESDPLDSGRLEIAYADMATAAGLQMPPTKLITVTVNNRQEDYFAVRRFDREANHKIHFLSLSGYAYANHRLPCLDYASGVLPAVKKLTRSDSQVATAFRLMLFNILAHNKDDHAKNFAFLRDAASGTWQLSPAFDLTFNHGMAGYHTTSVNGAGQPKLADIQKVAEQHRIADWKQILDEVRAAVADWPVFSAERGLSKKRRAEIGKALADIDQMCKPGVKQ